VDTGLLWYDDSKADFATKVLEAKERYEEKFGRKPNCCYVHPDCLPKEGIPANGIKFLASPTVLPNHFWMGVQEKGGRRMTHDETQLSGHDSLPWLLEDDATNPGVRYFALKDLVGKPADDPEVIGARRAVMCTGPVPALLEAQEAEGYWVKPGPGYFPQYRGTVWAVTMLAQLGADGANPRLHRGCQYVLDHTIDKNGAFSMSATPSGAILCLNGHLLAALIDLGWLGDERVLRALEWVARAVTGEGVAPSEDKEAPLRYLKSGTCGPRFCCSYNGKKPCAWGAVNVLEAFSRLPEAARTPLFQRAIDTGLEFLLSTDPAAADYPMGSGTKPSGNWFRFGFPLFWVADVLQNLTALTSFGYRSDPRLSAAMDFVLSKQDVQGRWKMERSYNGKTLVDIEEKGKPSKWVTLRAMRVLEQRE